MKLVFILCFVMVLDSMFSISSARILQSDSMKVSKHHDHDTKTKPAKSNNQLVLDPEGPVHTTDDGYTIMKIPKTAERHSLIDSLMNMFRNSTKTDHQAVIVIAPQTSPTWVDISSENKPKTEYDVADSVPDNEKLSAKETTVNETLLKTTDDQEKCVGAKIEMATWLRNHVLLLNKDSDSKKEFLVFIDDCANEDVDPVDFQFLDTTGSNDWGINKNEYSHHKATGSATSEHKDTATKSFSEQETSEKDSSSDPKVTGGKTSETHKVTDTSDASEDKDGGNTATSDHLSIEVPSTTAPTVLKIFETETTSDVEDTGTKVSSENIFSENTTSNPKNSGTETTSKLKSPDAESSLDFQIIDTTPTTATEINVIDITTSSNIKVSNNIETTTYATTTSDLPSTDLENTPQNHELVDPLTAQGDLQSSDTMISTSDVKAPTSDKLTDDIQFTQTLPLDSFDNLVNDLSIISNSIDVPIKLDATNKILNDGEPLIDVCRESQKELIDMFNLGLEQLSSLFASINKSMSFISTRTTQ